MPRGSSVTCRTTSRPTRTSPVKRSGSSTRAPLFPLLPAASRWRQTAAEILIREADRQILPDGVYMEQSTCYQRYTAEIYLHFVILASRNRILVPDDVIRRLESLLDALLALRRPNGSLPQIGDADGGSAPAARAATAGRSERNLLDRGHRLEARRLCLGGRRADARSTVAAGCRRGPGLRPSRVRPPRPGAFAPAPRRRLRRHAHWLGPRGGPGHPRRRAARLPYQRRTWTRRSAERRGLVPRGVRTSSIPEPSATPRTKDGAATIEGPRPTAR